MSIAMLLRSSLVTLSFALTATVARGQSCVIETDDDPLLKGARLMIAKIADDNPTTSHASEKPKHFRTQLVNLYEKSANIKNQIGRQYLLGRLYSIWLYINLPGTKTITTRGDLNLLGNPKGVHDLYAAMDSAFSKVEEMNPACTDSTSKYRAAVSLMAYNEATEMLKSGKYDSAAFLAKRALVADPKGAGPWNVLSEANRQRGDSAGYKEALRKVAQSPNSTDPVVRRVKAGAYRNLAVMAITAAQNSNDEAEKKRLAEQAESDLKELLKLEPNDMQAMTGLSRVYALKGDTAAAKGIMNEMMTNPEKFSAATLFEAAGAQFASGEYDAAIKLYESGLSKNTNFRNGVFSYISALLKAEDYAKAAVQVRKLLSLDPNSQETYNQAAATWQKVMLEAKDSVAQKNATDSTLHYVTLMKEAPVLVKVVDFVPAADGATFDVQINNQTDAAKSYDLEVEFLNATGGVVSTAKATFADVGAKGAKRQVVKGTGAGIVAWRYKPLKG